jgi:SAM-dependent methyltransferase
MGLARTVKEKTAVLLKWYGPPSVKKALWNSEFASEKWDFINHTEGDCVYPPLEKYARGGRVLDMGCGPGNTANEMRADAYREYVGVDISPVALEKARRRTAEAGREGQNRFAVGDFMTYAPQGTFDVILFRESLYHVPKAQVRSVLDRLGKYLNEGGIFVVRLQAFKNGQPNARTMARIRVIEQAYEVVEKARGGTGGDSVVLVFRPKPTSR